MLVADLTDNLFQQILDRHQPGDAAVFVDHDAHVLLLALHLAQQFVAALGLRHKRRRPLNAGDGPGRRASSSVICSRSCAKAMPVTVSSVPSKTGTREKVCSFSIARKLDRRSIRGDREDLRPRRHHFAHQLVAELDRRAHQVAVALFQDAFFFARFEQRTQHRRRRLIFFGFGSCGGCARETIESGNQVSVRAGQHHEAAEPQEPAPLQHPRARGCA